MKLSVDDAYIPFMAWSAGQKEFLPLLLSFYYLSKVPNNIAKAQDYQTVIIEEPEMGLHPKAILSVILEMIDLMAAGYRLIVSTHSFVLLEFAWAFNALQQTGSDQDEMIKALCEMFEVNENTSVARSFGEITEKSINTYYFSPNAGGNRVQTKNISSLDAGASDQVVAEWGGLSHFAGKAADVVLNYAGDRE